MILPYGALPGVSLDAAIRDVAAHYNVPAAQLRRGDGRKAQLIALARHALFWKLTKQHRYSATRVADLLRCSAKTVREGAALHFERIEEFKAASDLGAPARTPSPLLSLSDGSPAT